MTSGSVPRHARKRHLLIRDDHGGSNGQAYRLARVGGTTVTSVYQSYLWRLDVWDATRKQICTYSKFVT
jgi:hypothetical protein